jgi:hypothetical protein
MKSMEIQSPVSTTGASRYTLRGVIPSETIVVTFNEQGPFLAPNLEKTTEVYLLGNSVLCKRSLKLDTGNTMAAYRQYKFLLRLVAPETAPIQFREFSMLLLKATMSRLGMKTDHI